LDFTTDDGWVRGVVVEAVGATNSGVVLRSESRSGSFFCILDLAQDVAAGYQGQTNAGTYYATSPDAVCAGETFVADVAAGW
jgi:hypothetical protein